MNDLEQTRSNPESDNAAPEPRPSKDRERRGWPFWVVLVLALAALAFYTLTGELGGVSSRQPQPQPRATTTTGK